MILKSFKKWDNLLNVIFPEVNWASERRKLPESKVAPESCKGPSQQTGHREDWLTVIIILSFSDQKENH